MHVGFHALSSFNQIWNVLPIFCITSHTKFHKSIQYFSNYCRQMYMTKPTHEFLQTFHSERVTSKNLELCSELICKINIKFHKSKSINQRKECIYVSVNIRATCLGSLLHKVLGLPYELFFKINHISGKQEPPFY
jgi:hypothetical protein